MGHPHGRVIHSGPYRPQPLKELRPVPANCFVITKRTYGESVLRFI